MITDDKTKTQKGYKSTVIGMLPQEWDVKKLKEITDYVDYRGKTPPKVENGIFLVTAKNIKDGFIDYDISKEYVKEEDYESIMRRGKPKIGDVLLTTEAPLGNVAQVDRENIALAQRIIKFRGKKGLSNDYLKYHFLSNQFQERLKKRAIGTTVLGIQGKELHNMYIPIPSLEEQQKIADILSTWDKAIKIKEKLIEQKKLQKKGLMQKLLTGEVRLPGFEGEWKLKKLKSLCTKIIDGTHSTPKYTESGIPFYSVENVTNRDFTNCKFISEEEHLAISSRCKVQKGDILMTRIGSIGDAVLVDWDHECSIYVSLALIKTSDAILSEYLVQYMGTHQFKKEILSKSLLSATPQKINLVDIGNVNIYFPQDILEQKAVVDVLSKVDKEICLLEQELEVLKQQKKGLMQLLLTGKVRVKV